MKQFSLVMLCVILLLGLVSCREPAPEGTPTYVYDYEFERAMARPVGDLDASLFLRPDLPEEDRELYYHTSGYDRTLKGHTFDVFGPHKPMAFMTVCESYPEYPLGTGRYAVFSYDNRRFDLTPHDCGTAHIREETGEVLYLEGQSETLFRSLDLADRDAMIAFATEKLSEYTSFDGYTRFIYEDKVYGSEGLTVEYNLTVGGKKTDCYVKMGIGYDGYSFMLKIANQNEPAIKPYVEATVVDAYLDEIIDPFVDRYYRGDTKYEIDSYIAHTVLTVKNETLYAYVTIEVKEAYLSQEGMKVHYGDEAYDLTERTDVTAIPARLLIRIATIEYRL